MTAQAHADGFPGELVDRLLDIATEAATPFAIAGVQGSGKSTLAGQLARAAADRRLRTAVLSLDDVYLDRPARRVLARDVHPLLARRGPPGTHDVQLALDVLDALLARRPVRLPRFDKLGDVRLPESAWPHVDACDLVLVEGWCLRVPPECADALDAPINAIEREEDADGTWRRWCDDALARDYPPLWARLPRLLFLEPPGFHVVPHWRMQQERAMHEAAPHREAMTPEGVARFVQLFERVSRQALRTLPAIADVRIRLDTHRRPVGIARRDVPPPPPTIGA